ncbi:hypothetical protein KKE60_02720 [Patescibacteria group bacterium]|nr:hypothetical protein [Patescibacteria group bacterium]MBU0776832.1 hypothetical protein [Patescibacteria group bacterium]MBU1066686.1 hypothetical protein [Patescibacteria group bacterium]MBU1845053.1 hypothetical protein [Patescibacteria group bacterium]
MITLEALSTWQTALIGSWGQVWLSFLGVIPSILGAIIIFAVGLILAFWAKRLVIEFLKLIRFEKLVNTAGIDRYLKKADFKLSLVDILGTIVEWIVILVFFLAVVDILGLSAVSVVLATVLGYIPNVFAAALIIAVGYMIAGIVEGLVRGALVSIDHDIAKPTSKFARWIIMIVAVFAAIDQLQIAQGLIATFFQGLTYTIVLAVGLSFGLGAKDLIARVLNDWYDKIRK